MVRMRSIYSATLAGATSSRVLPLPLTRNTATSRASRSLRIVTSRQRRVFASEGRMPVLHMISTKLSGRALRGLHPRPPDGVKFAVFFWAERVAAHLRERRSALKQLICPDVAFFDRVAHHGAEDGHLEADGGIAHLRAQTPLAVLAPPGRIVVPAVLPDQMDLGR